MLLVGFYEKEITPPVNYSAGEPGPFIKTTENRLYVKAVACESGDKRALYIAVDDLKINSQNAESILSRIYQMTGIKRDSILLTGANFDNKSGITESINTDDNYINTVIRQVADCAVLAFRQMEPAWHNFVNKKSSAELKDKAETEEAFTFDAIYFTNEKGSAIGAFVDIFHYNNSEGYNRNYVNCIDKELKKAEGMEFVAVFTDDIQGIVKHFKFLEM